MESKEQFGIYGESEVAVTRGERVASSTPATRVEGAGRAAVKAPEVSGPGRSATQRGVDRIGGRAVQLGSDEVGGWQDFANCLGVDPDLFFPERGASTREAKEICRGCVVREDCLEYALTNSEKFGIWGGMSERERRRIRRQRALARRATGI